LRRNDTLLKSNNTIKILLLQMFIIFRVILVALLLNSHAKVHISFDLQYQATDIKAPRTPPNLNITTHHFYT